MIYLLFCN